MIIPKLFGPSLLTIKGLNLVSLSDLIKDCGALGRYFIINGLKNISPKEILA